MKLAGMAILASITGAISVLSLALAQPSVPATFYGSVTINGEAAPTGTEIRGFVGNLDCTQSAPGERPAIREGNATAYVIAVVHESQRPGCGRTGTAITFTINGEPADQAAEWQAGPTQVDLSIGPGDIVPLPTATATIPGPPPTSTSLPSEPSPIPGTPPTDDITFPGTQSPPSNATPGDDGIVSAASADDDDGSGSSAFPIVVAILGILAVAGAAAGFALSRRPGPRGPG